MPDNAPVLIAGLMATLKEMQDNGMSYVSFDRVSGGVIPLGFERPEDHGIESTSAFEYDFIPALGKASRQ